MSALDEARQHEKEAHESFERCDTDGFLTQWAHGVSAQRLRLQHEIDQAGGTSVFPGLYNEAGQRVKAKLVNTQYGTKWLVLGEGDDEILHWVSIPSNPHHPSGRSKMGQLGLHHEEETAPAAADLAGTGTGLSGAHTVHAYVKRTDQGYPETAVVL